ncbi:MAG TPA: peptidoglycan-binding domain-containing protein [Terriglobia bacterium]|nr:peptidoglycan-binding domain-containing protein [Terriglobia bacterium]
MTTQWLSRIRNSAGAVCIAVFFSANLVAFDRMTVPAGTVVELQTTSALDSGTAQQGDTFSATVRRSISINGVGIIPLSSSVDGRVTEVRRAVRGSRSGVLGVEFFRLVLADGTSFDISGELTTRRVDDNGQANNQNGQLGQRDNANVLIGGSDGTVIGSVPRDSRQTIGGALGDLLSGGREAQLPSRSIISMELVNDITINFNDQGDTGLELSSPNMIQGAQEALHNQNAYDGPINGRLDNQTRQAISRYQRRNGLPVTGQLDQQTAESLGLMGDIRDDGRRRSKLFDRRLAASIYRKAQSLLSIYQSSLGISVNDISAGLSSNRDLTEGDLDLLLQTSSFSNAAAWYQQAMASGRNDASADVAARIMVSSAQRVDASLQNAQNNSQFAQAWASIQSDLGQMGGNKPSENNIRSNSDNNSVPSGGDDSGQVSGPGHFQWQGLVDGSDNIKLHGSQVTMAHLTASNIQEATYQLSTALPFGEVQVSLQKVRGRGSIRLLEQPSSSNNYTAVVQVNDQGNSGRGWYEFTLDW